MVALLLIPAFALLNHIRGGAGLFAPLASLVAKLPGRAIYWCAPVAGLLAWPVLGGANALLFALTYLAWGIPEWGRWYTLNRESRSISGEPSAWAALLERYADRIPWGQITDPETNTPRNDYACFTIRNTVLLLPLAVISPWLVLLGPLQTVAYEIAHRVRHPGGVAVGELIFGGMIAAALALV